MCPVSSVQVGQFLQTAGRRFRLNCKAFLALSGDTLNRICSGAFPCNPFQLSPVLPSWYILDLSKGPVIVLLSSPSYFSFLVCHHQSRETIPQLTPQGGAFRLCYADFKFIKFPKAVKSALRSNDQ